MFPGLDRRGLLQPSVRPPVFSPRRLPGGPVSLSPGLEWDSLHTGRMSRGLLWPGPRALCHLGPHLVLSLPPSLDWAGLLHPAGDQLH